jgi:membrane-bound serine protease (ClpP class)
MKRRNKLRCTFVVFATLLYFSIGSIAMAPSFVVLVRFKGPITPVVLSYMRRGIELAEDEKATCLIIQLDTPGGSISIMEEVIKEIRGASVPVVIYVAPRGATAASAGTLITLAGHAAAMAPDTTIGAASPIAIGPGGTEVAERKGKEILKAIARTLAQRRGEEAMGLAERMVEEALALTAREALESGLIDFIADDIEDLLTKLDGFEVSLYGKDVVLHTRGARVKQLPMNPLERLLHAITDPNIAFILLTLGINALIYELSSPGGYVAGIFGAICIGLSLYALGVLSVDYTGLLFIALGLALFIAEIVAQTEGILAAGGIASLILGSFLLFDSPYYTVSRGLIIGVSLASGALSFFIVTKAVRARRRPVTTGLEGMVGEVGVVRRELNPEGIVFIHGEFWSAISEEGTIEEGKSVRVIAIEGLRLRVRAVD